MIHPRRLKGTPTNIARYYAVGDYYTKGEGEHSQWGGLVADELGLTGKVDPSVLRELLAGKIGHTQLGRRRADGMIEHHPGWDFAVNAPKSVSIMALVMGDERISAAHEAAVTEALGYLEEHATLRRRADREVVHETTGRLIYARFTEHASRELDPHLHTHVVIMNMTNRGDGEQIVSLETRAMYAEQMVAGQVYRNQLAHRIRELGYEVDVDPRRGLFEIRGVPTDLMREMSQRAEQIDAHAKEHGLEGQAARRKSFYETRGPKERATVQDLHVQWDARLGRHREPLEEAKETAILRGGCSIQPAPALSARAMLFGLRHSEGREAVNNLGQLLRAGLASHLGDVRLSDIRPLAEEHEARRKLLEVRQPTGDLVLTRGRTTRRTARLELALSDHLALALGDASPLADEARLREASVNHGLTPAQVTGLLHLGMSPDRLVGVHGVAGAGKSMLVGALREASDERFTMIALAPTSSAAAELGKRAGIESRTVASLVARGGRGLDENSVLILDEAGQLGNRQAIRLLEISRPSGARLIMLGDNRQTGAIEQGKPFWLMQRLGLSRVDLMQSVRQETRAMKAAVALARAGDYAGSLANLDKVLELEKPEELAGSLVREWTRLKPETRTTTNILVLDNASRLIVNSKVREALRTEGAIGAEDVRLSVLTPAGLSDAEKRYARFYNRGQILTFSRSDARLGIAHDGEYRVIRMVTDDSDRQMLELADEHGRTIRWNPRLGKPQQVNAFNVEDRELSHGDRIQWRLVSHDLGIKNAERGTVEALNGSRATIRWDTDNRCQSIDLAEHKTWDHGYAETIYAAQSKTYDRAYVLAPLGSPLVNGKNYYTAITRARFGVKLWTQHRDKLADLLARRSGDKTSALEGLGRVERDSVKGRALRHSARWDRMRGEQRIERAQRNERIAAQRASLGGCERGGLAASLAERGRSAAAYLHAWLQSFSAADHADAVAGRTKSGAQATAQHSTQDRGASNER
ncbi:conjugative relaxase-like TrwC/TraI family protein [Novosphingobium sp. PhB165]|uniref:MobF family relaxase n=1 Tax=Novosphingobium sp. PhB165 TaxID=2485105 RepID=UPI001046FFF0|nr:MobF family relaxase [Novosphingobium sp. PhB165]TCM14035.1 conjugative relaxase-like TrwC/TraI family protein [Novosphingobium sp. PhB165]